MPPRAGAGERRGGKYAFPGLGGYAETVTDSRDQRGSRRGLWITLSIIFGALALVALVYAADLLLTRGNVPRGATVGGVEIGGMAKEEAAEKLETELGDVAIKPVSVHAGEMFTQFIPADSGVAPDWAATVEDAGAQSLNPITRVRGFFDTYEVDIVSRADDTAFTATLERVRGDLSREPHNGGVAIEAGRVVTDPAVNGQEINREELRKRVTSEWLNPEGIEIEAKIVEPDIRNDAVQRAAEGDAAKAVSAPVVAQGRDGVKGVIPVERMGEVVTFAPDKGALRTDVNLEAAQAMLAEGLASTERTRTNAQISFAGGSKRVTPHVDGVSIDWDKSATHLRDRIVGTQPRQFDVIYIDEPASFTTQAAEAATFDEVVGEFTTDGYSEASGKNIALVAQAVNGALVPPGETFSLNGYTGPRGKAQGYVESGIILNGHADEAVGGGISQFATTLYNASYFAGMTDVAHTPHSYYISRYPAGREATVYEGAIDLQFRNDSDHPVRIDTSVGDGSVTVKLMGVKTVNVESINGGRWAQTSPETLNLSGDKCSASSGAPGFTTSDTRIIKDLSGAEISREETTTVYDPQPIVKCS
ncbi:Vancomycin B-type resistance protein VanW [Corynebacterium lowii]|uniref:Vancomycin B-type resistance protein VanW n=1 Tax=Corynebacterium lowii TaxID=1544413 RepID=A0A0N8W095_9CORY|nr:Vancomycin B-type resistance protein VanW [Corynebacterium lowii]